MGRGAPAERYNERYNGIIKKIFINISFSKLNCISHCISRPTSAQSSVFPFISALNVSLSPCQRAHPGVSLAAPWLLPGCFPAFLIVPWPALLLPGCPWLSGYVCSWLLLGLCTLRDGQCVCVCVCKLPRSGTSARGGNKKRDSVFNCPLRRTHGYQLKPSATHISNTTTALQSNTARPCACRKLGK